MTSCVQSDQIPREVPTQPSPSSMAEMQLTVDTTPTMTYKTTDGGQTLDMNRKCSPSEHSKGNNEPVSVLMSLLAALFYGSMSVSLSLVNKYILTNHEFNAVFTLFAIQALMVVLFLSLVKIIASIIQSIWKTANLKIIDDLLPPISLELSKEAVMPALCAAGNTILSLVGYKISSIPAFQAVRRTSPLFTMIIGAVFFQKKMMNFTGAVSISFLVLGAYLGVDDSFRGGPQGVVCALANNVMTALTFLMVKKLTDRTNLSALGVCYYNSMIAFPFAVMAIFIFDEHKYLKEYTGTADEGFILSIITSCTFGLLLNLSSFVCVMYTSALATTVVGCVKDIALTILSISFFSDFSPTWLNIFGLSLSFVGSGLYGFARYPTAEDAKEKQDSDMSADDTQDDVEKRPLLEHPTSRSGSKDSNHTDTYVAHTVDSLTDCSIWPSTLSKNSYHRKDNKGKSSDGSLKEDAFASPKADESIPHLRYRHYGETDSCDTSATTSAPSDRVSP